MKVLKIAAMVIGAVALVATGIGLAAGAGSLSAAFNAGLGTIGLGGLSASVGLGTMSAVALGALAIDASMLAAKFGPKPPAGSGSQVKWKADPYAGMPYVVGRTRVGGNIIYRAGHGGTNNDYQTIVTALSVGPIKSIQQTIMNGAAVTFLAGGAASGAFAGQAWQVSQLGACPEATALTCPVDAAPGWTSSHKLSGLAAVLNTFKYDTKSQQQLTSVPDTSHVVEGVYVYDPRQDSTYPGGSGPCRAYDESTYVWSENPHLHALTWAIGRWHNGVRVAGIGTGNHVSGSEVKGVDVASFVEGANLDDARGWKIGGEVRTRGDTPWNVLKLMLQSGGAEPELIGGIITSINQAPRVSLATIGPNDIVGECSFSGTQRRRSRINGIIPTYRSEAHDWELVPAKEVSVPAFVAMDGDERTRDLPWPLVQNVDQVSQLALYEIYNAREAGPGSVPLKPYWLNYRPGDCVTFAPEPGLSIKAMIRGRAPDLQTGVVTYQLRGETDAKHAFALGQTGTAPPVSGFSYSNDVPTPASMDWAISGLNLSANGVVTPALVLTGTCGNSSADAILVEYRTYFAGQADDAGWIGASLAAPVLTRREITGLRSGTSYEVGVRYRVRGVLGPRRILGPVTVSDQVMPATGVKFGDGTLVQDRQPAESGATRGAIAGVNLRNNADTAYLGDGDIITSAGVAAGIAGQGPGATAGAGDVMNYAVGLGQNAITNSGFENGLYGWSNGWHNYGSSFTPDSGTNLSGWYGALNVAWTRIVGTPSAGIFDSQVLADGNPKRWWLAVVEGDRVFASALVAYHRLPVAPDLKVGWYDASGTYLTESHVASGGAEYGGANGNPSSFTRVGGFVVAPAGARYCRLWVRGTTTGGQTDPYLFYTQMMLCRVPASQTAWPVYARGGADILANVTSEHTAAAIANQGPLATVPSAAPYTNSALTIGSNGLLYGGGGGQVTIGGLGFVGELNATFGARAGVNLRNNADTAYLGDGDIITSSGTAAAISGQGYFATQNYADWGSRVTGAGKPADNATVGARVGVNLRNSADTAYLGDVDVVTNYGTAAAFTGQTAWATYSGLTPTTVAGQVQNLQADGYLQALHVYKPGGDLLSNRWPAEAGANITESRTAAAFYGQGGLATKNSVTWSSEISGRPSFVTDTIVSDGAERLNPWYVRNPADGSLLGARWAAEGGANVTEIRAAAAISGQAWAATNGSQSAVDNNYVAGFANQAIDSEFTLQNTCWNEGYATGGTWNWGYFTWTSRRFIVRDNASAVAGQQVNLGQTTAYGLPVVDGDRIECSAILAWTNMDLAELYVGWFTSTGAYVGATLVAYGVGDTPVGGFATVPAGLSITTAKVLVGMRVAANGYANARMSQPFIRRCGPNQATLSYYNPGPLSERGANVTETRVAAAIAGQGAGATANSLAGLDATAAAQLAAAYSGGVQVAGYGETLKRRIANGASLGLSGNVACDAGGSTSGSIACRIEVSEFGSGSWSTVATGSGDSCGPTEPGSDGTSGTYTNSSGVEKLYEFRVIAVRTPGTAGGAIIYAQSYVVG